MALSNDYRTNSRRASGSGRNRWCNLAYPQRGTNRSIAKRTGITTFGCRKMGFIHLPRPADYASISLRALPKLRSVILHRPQDGRVRQANTAPAHHGHQIARAQFVTAVPANAHHDDLSVKVPTLEQLPRSVRKNAASVQHARRRVCTRVTKRFTAGTVLDQATDQIRGAGEKLIVRQAYSPFCLCTEKPFRNFA